jgi:hypothetical protein
MAAAISDIDVVCLSDLDLPSSSIMRAITLLICVMMICVILADASRSHHHRHSLDMEAKYASRLARHTHETDIDPSNINRPLPSREYWAPVRAALEARNYQRPTENRPETGFLGVDVAVPVPASQWSCLVASGYSFAIVRAGRSTCAVDENGVHTVAAAVNHICTAMGDKYICLRPFSECNLTLGSVSPVRG